MAEKRMFTKKITESDSFLDMPLSAQCLYFHLNMNADDDGFVNAPRKIQRLIGAKDDDLKLLIMKSFVLVFENGVLVIKHWRMHNTIRQDRYHPTDYQEEYRKLSLKENNSYTWQPNGNQMETENRLGLDLDKNSKKENNKRKKYGSFENVNLTDEEYEKLKNKFNDYQDKIENLSNYIASKGDKYKSHYATILNWARKDSEEKGSIPSWFNKEPEERKMSEDEQRQLEELIRGY